MSSSSAARVHDLLAAPEETFLEPAVSVARLPRSEPIAPDVTAMHGAEMVAADVELSAPRRARPGRALAFRGGLAGGYVPLGGALVSLAIFFAGEWREIALLRTNRHGAFAYRYTFAAIGPATYRFRAQLPHTIGYPFASGASRSSYIRVAG